MTKKDYKIEFNYWYVIGGLLFLVALFLIVFNLDSSNCGDGTVILESSDVCWQVGTKPNGASSLDDAISYCDNLELAGKKDWRLPEVEELSTLVDEKNIGLVINESIFVGTLPTSYWTASLHPNKDDMYWYISFANGHQGYAFGFQKDYGVRCVRG